MISKFTKSLSYFFKQDNYNKFKDSYSDRELFLQKQKKIKYHKTRLLAICDYADIPYTNDIGNLLLKAEVERRRYNLDKIDIVFVTNDIYPGYPGYQPYINKDNYKNLIYNLSIEYTRLFPTVGSFLVLDNRNQAIAYINAIKDQYKLLYPYDYNPNTPYERIMAMQDRPRSFYLNDYYSFAQKDSTANCLRPDDAQVELARKWIKKNIYPKVPIIISIRESKQEKDRDTNLPEWQKLVSSYKNDDRYIFVILVDYYGLYTKDNIIGQNTIYCNEAVLSVSFRAALYQESTVVMLNSNSSLCWYNCNVNYLFFGLGCQKVGSATLKALKECINLDFGDNFHGSTKYQRLIWKEDRFDVLKSELNDMLRLLEEDNNLYPKFYDKDFVDEKETIIFDEKIYKQSSTMSKRIPLKYYIYSYKIFKFIKKIFKSISYTSLEEINIKKDDKIILYGAGTVAQNLIKKYKENIIGIVDKNFDSITNNSLNSVKIYSIESLKDINYTYLVVTPKFREYSIIHELKEKYIIKDSKFLLGSKYD
jgi:hypothetical protein